MLVYQRVYMIIYCNLVCGLEPWNFVTLYWEWNNHPNWRSHIFQRGWTYFSEGLKPPTSNNGIMDYSWDFMGLQLVIHGISWDFIGFHGIIWVSYVVTLLRQKPGKIMNDGMCPPISISILYQTYTVHKIYVVHIIQIIYTYIHTYIHACIHIYIYISYIYIYHIYIYISYIYIYIYLSYYIYNIILYIIIIYYNIYFKYPQRFFLQTISRSPPTEIHSLKADGWKDISTRGPETEHVWTWWTERSGIDWTFQGFFHEFPWHHHPIL